MRFAHVDFHFVAPEQRRVHNRLENWGAYVKMRRGAHGAPMWRFTRSNSRMWEPPQPRENIDACDGDVVEHIVAGLPSLYRHALRWCYVDRTPPARMVRTLNVSYPALLQLICDARQLVAFALSIDVQEP